MKKVYCKICGQPVEIIQSEVVTYPALYVDDDVEVDDPEEIEDYAEGSDEECSRDTYEVVMENCGCSGGFHWTNAELRQT